MATVAVVGGTGFLGRHVVAALQEAGHTVRVLSRRTGLDVSGTDAVVNLAGIKREEGSQTFHAVHVELVHQLVAAMKAEGIRRLIHISVVVARPAPELPYHDTKWQGEEVVRSSGLDYTILRPGVIYGEGDDMLRHLSLMVRTSPLFPIVGRGVAPMRPVDVHDVASAVVKTLQVPCSGKTYDVVGPDKLELREVVRRVAQALSVPVWILPTPITLMRIPVGIMEAVMKQPLSTRAQLAMLAEGLDGNPEPARRELGLSTTPFTTAHVGRILWKTQPVYEVSSGAFWKLVLFAVAALALVFGFNPDKWMGMTVAMGICLTGTLFVRAARRRLKPSLFRIATGMGAGVVLYGVSVLAAAVIFQLRPEWTAEARMLYTWKSGHSPLFLTTTLVMIVLAEEMLWRGVIAQFLIERWGRVTGIVLAAAIYAVAHLAAGNPLLVIAAFGCGIYWGLVYAATDDLVAPTVSHLVWDVLLLFALPVV